MDKEASGVGDVEGWTVGVGDGDLEVECWEVELCRINDNMGDTIIGSEGRR